MAQVAFLYYSITTGGTPQPLLGSYITASVAAGDNIVLTVNDITPFSLNGTACDWVVIQAADGTLKERAKVDKVDVANKKLTVRHLDNAHTGGVFGTGHFVSLARAINNVYVQLVDGGTAPVYIGDRPTMVKATGVGVIKKMVQVGAGVSPVDIQIGPHGAVNADDTSQLWVDGTTGDKYLPSIDSL